jgi:hypothetical protein
MAVTLNANSSTGFIATSDTSGVLQLQTGGTTAVTISSGQVATFAQAPVLPAASIPQAALAANVAGNGPAFSALISGSDQIVSSGVWTKAQLNAEDFDTANAFDSTTNYRFQPTVAGYYFMQGQVSMVSGAFTACQVSIYKNGSAAKSAYNYSGLNYLDDWSTSVSCLIYLNGSTDYLELYGFSVSGTPRFAFGSTFMSGYLARAA